MNILKKIVSAYFKTKQMRFSFCSKNTFELNLSKAQEVLKVANITILNQPVLNTIEILFMCSIYKNYDPQLIPKIETKLSMSLRDLDERNLSKVLHSFSVINYNTKNLNFLIERTLVNRLDNITIPIFVKILKSLSMHKTFVISTGLLNVIKSYIDKNILKMNVDQLASVFIEYSNIPNSNSEMLKKLYYEIEKDYDKLNSNILAYLYFIINGGIRNKGFEEIVTKPEYIDIIVANDSPNPKLIYLLVLANHFNKNNKLDIYLEKNILELCDKFTPEELNSIILIRNSKEYKVNEELNRKFVEIALKESGDMSLDELILYLQSILSLPEKNIEAINIFEEIIYKTKFSSVKIYQIVSLLDLIRHFGAEYFKIIKLEILADIIMKEMMLSTTSDLTTNLLSDYYIIAIILFDLKYRNKEFWQQYLGYSCFIKEPKLAEKMNKIINKLSEEIPELK
jgi:hypothetical protein